MNNTSGRYVIFCETASERRAVRNNRTLFRAKEDENPPPSRYSRLAPQKKKKKKKKGKKEKERERRRERERRTRVDRKRVKIRVTWYSADTVLSVLDNIVDNARNSRGERITARRLFSAERDQKPISARNDVNVSGAWIINRSRGARFRFAISPAVLIIALRGFYLAARGGGRRKKGPVGRERPRAISPIISR